MTTKSINDRLGDGGLESVVVFAEDTSQRITGIYAPDGSVIQMPRILDQYYEPVRRDSDGATDTTNYIFAQITVPGYTMNLNGRIDVIVEWEHTSSAVVKALSVDWDGWNIIGPWVTTSTRSSFRASFQNKNSYVNQIALSKETFGSGSKVEPIVDTREDQLIEIKGKWNAMATSEYITMLGYSVVYYPGNS